MSTTQYFKYRGDSMAYTREGCGAPILFLHNGGTSKEIWIQQVGELSDRHEVICLDLLGFGESALPDSGYLITDYVDRLEAFIEHLSFDRVSVVGNCMGSAMTLLLAKRRPELFHALVLINPLTEQTARRGVIGWVMWLPVRFPRLSLAISRRVRAPRFLTTAIVIFQFGPRHWWRGFQTPPPGARAAGATWATPGRLVTMAEMFSDTSALAELDRFSPPADFPPFVTVWGASNLGLSPRVGAKLNQTLEPNRQEFLPDCGHLPMMENPAAVSQIIDDFLVGVIPHAPANNRSRNC